MVGILFSVSDSAKWMSTYYEVEILFLQPISCNDFAEDKDIRSKAVVVLDFTMFT